MIKQEIARFLNLRAVLLMARLILGGTFIYASFDKLAFPAEFASIVSNYDILPNKIGPLFAYILPWSELFLGIFLVVGLFIRPTAVLLSFLLSVFMIAIILKSIEGEIENCGCFAIMGGQGGQSLISLIMRNILLLFLCFIIIVRKKSCVNKLNIK